MDLDQQEDIPLMSRKKFTRQKRENEPPCWMTTFAMLVVIGLVVLIALLILAAVRTPQDANNSTTIDETIITTTTIIINATTVSTSSSVYQYSSNCTPQCYSCGTEPFGNATCIPVVTPTSCHAECQNLTGNCSNCSIVCQPLHCHYDCPHLEEQCPLEMCPQCETVCSNYTSCEVVCVDENQQAQCNTTAPICSPLCQETMANWQCLPPVPLTLLDNVTCGISCDPYACAAI